MEEDFEVYNFDSLELGNENFNGFYNEEEEEDLGWDDETFGDENNKDLNGKPLGRDFDFAGSTSRFLGGQQPQQFQQFQQQQQQVLQPTETSWTNTSQPSKFPSPWSTLDADPLLSSRPLSSSKPLLPSSTPPTPSSVVSQQSQQPKRVMRTLEEIESELRNQSSNSRPSSVNNPPPPPARQGKTLEEVEAEMLRGRQQQQQQQQQQQYPPQMMQQQYYPQQQQQQQQPFNLNSPFPPPPQHQQQQQQQQFPYSSQQQQLQFPPQFPQQQQQQRSQSGTFLPSMSPRPGQQSSAIQGVQGVQGIRPSTPSQLQVQQLQQQQQHIQSQQQQFVIHQQQMRATQLAQQISFQQQQQAAQQQTATAVGQQQQQQQINMMNTLFPPLPSQIPPPVPSVQVPVQIQIPTVLSLSQQLNYLSQNQHTQHPSLTGAQLQILLQQAQAQSQSQSISTSLGDDVVVGSGSGSREGKEKGEGGEGEEEGEEEDSLIKEIREEKLRQVRAGEELIRNVEERIREHEMIELRRKVKASKIQGMSKHNNLMSNSDKDFITRIQVSQLVTDDPYADDFYFHIMAAIKQSRLNVQRQSEMLINGQNQNQNSNSNGGNMQSQVQQQGGLRMNGNGNGNGNNRRPTRRENAMNKMAQNVQRLVDSAKSRNKSGQLSIDGALGKIALRTRSAPRQLLQVTSATSTTTSTTPSAGHALLAGLISNTKRSTSSSSSTTANQIHDHENDSNEQQPPLNHRAILSIVEEIYDSVLDLEQLRRIQPSLLNNLRIEKEMANSRRERMVVEGGEAEEVVVTSVEGEQSEGEKFAEKALEEWQAKCTELSEKLWNSMRVMEPLDISVPHPFISLISVLKGKRILPRALRHCSPEQTLTLLTLMVATFDTLDTVVDAPLLDTISDIKLEGTEESRLLKASIENKTEVFLHAIISPVMSVIGSAPLRLVTGMLGLLIERNDILKVVRSKPGIAFLTVFLTRAESLKQATPAPEAQDLQQWSQVFRTLFNSLSDHFPSLFPSTRSTPVLPFGVSYYLQDQVAATTESSKNLDLEDEPVWRFLAAVAVCADPQEQQDLVTAVRDKVLENVSSAKKLKVTPEVAALKIRNVDLLLNSLGLSATQLTVED